jgi:hypothetical protein
VRRKGLDGTVEYRAEQTEHCQQQPAQILDDRRDAEEPAQDREEVAADNDTVGVVAQIPGLTDPGIVEATGLETAVQETRIVVSAPFVFKADGLPAGIVSRVSARAGVQLQPNVAGSVFLPTTDRGQERSHGEAEGRKDCLERDGAVLHSRHGTQSRQLELLLL